VDNDSAESTLIAASIVYQNLKYEVEGKGRPDENGRSQAMVWGEDDGDCALILTRE
jgi:hypothetical protein